MAYGVGPLTINDFDGDLTMRVDLSEHMGGKIFWFGYYDRDELMAINQILRPGMFVVDVGANIGEVTLFCAKRDVGGEGKVFSFEPEERIHPVLLEEASGPTGEGHPCWQRSLRAMEPATPLASRSRPG